MGRSPTVGGVRARFGQELRARWLAMVGFAVLIGVLGGVVLATTAGARRTGTAYDRFLEHARAEDILLGFLSVQDPLYPELLDTLETSPLVESVVAGAAMGLLPGGTEVRIADSVAPFDTRLLHEIDRPNIVDGRLPDPERPNEVMINPALRDGFGVDVGDQLDFYGTTEQEYYAHPGQPASTYGERRPLRVVGVGVLPQHVVPQGQFDEYPLLMLSPAYAAAHPDEMFSYSYLWVRLADGAADNEAFDDLLSATLQDLGLDVAFIPEVRGSDRRAGIIRAIRPQAQALAVFALLLGLVTVCVVGQLLTRHLQADQLDRRRLWALGFTRGELLAVAVLRVVLILLGAVVVALAVAIGLSSRFPIGPARLAEPNPGTAVNLSVLGLGALGLFAVFLAVATFSVRRSLPRLGTAIDGDPPGVALRRSRLADLLCGAGVASTCVIGVRMAFERGRGSTAVPALGAIAASGLAIGALATAFTFSANLERLVDTPALYGWTWDAQLGTSFNGLDLEEVRPVLDEAHVTAYSGANVGRLQLASPDRPDEVENVPAIGIDQLEGEVYPRLIDGRAATAADEIVLGRRVADRFGVGVGDEVLVGHVGREGTDLRRVVGLAVLPGLGAGIFSTTDLGEGAVVPAADLADETAGELYTSYLIDLDPSADRQDAEQTLLAGIAAIDPNCVQPACLFEDLKPPGIKNYASMRSTPLLLAGVLAVLAVITLAINLVTSVRRRRRDFAVLRSVGYLRRQVAAVCAWQAATVAVAALVVGLPLGVVAGRQLWVVFADGAGASVPPDTPVLAVLLAVPVTVLVAVLISLWPGRAASRVQAAQVLRSE